MKGNLEIRKRGGKVIIPAGKYTSIKEAVEKEYKNLSFADLSFANLSFADLSFADLSFANLSFADLSSAITTKRYIQIACIGSRKGMTTYCFEDDLIMCGCWQGKLKDFEERVKETHKDNKQYLAEYLGFITYIKDLRKL